MKAILIGDVHLSDRPPSIRTDDYSSDVLKKLEFVVKKSNELEVDLLIFAGDVFHIKTPSRTSHGLVASVGDLLKRANMPVRIVPGNHDMQHDRLDSLDSQPLGVLSRMPNVDLLVGWDPEYPVFGIPYLWDWKKDLPAYMSKWRGSSLVGTNTLMVTHAPIVQPGRTLPYEFIDADDWAKMMGAGACYFGHMHDWDGTFLSNTDAGVEFCNQGALSRGSLHESSLKRKPAVTLFDEDGFDFSNFERIEVPHKPVEEVFRLTLKKVEDERAQTLDEFLDSIAGTQLELLSVESVLEHAKGLALKPGTLDQIESCLEHAINS